MRFCLDIAEHLEAKLMIELKPPNLGSQKKPPHRGGFDSKRSQKMGWLTKIELSSSKRELWMPCSPVPPTWSASVPMGAKAAGTCNFSALCFGSPQLRPLQLLCKQTPSSLSFSQRSAIPAVFHFQQSSIFSFRLVSQYFSPEVPPQSPVFSVLRRLCVFEIR